MFAGIVQTTGEITSLQQRGDVLCVGLRSKNIDFLKDVILGASVSVSGVCLTVVKIQNYEVFFDVVLETIERSTLRFLEIGAIVNLERSLKMGEEIGGHFLSGHVFGTAKIVSIQNGVWFFDLKEEYLKYIFEKGFVAIDGCSLTIVKLDRVQNVFGVALIPETLRQTIFGVKKVGDIVNVEIDFQTKAVVDTVERMMKVDTKV